MKTILTFCLMLLLAQASAQFWGGEEIDSKNLSSWLVESPDVYSVSYHFGFSEDESELSIIVSDSLVVAQLLSFKWVENRDWVDTFQTFTNVKIIGNKFYSDQYNGEFVFYDTRMESSLGLLIYKPWGYKFNDGGEFGNTLSGESVYLNGTYPSASLKLLGDEELGRLTKTELKLMRNEIFARYGYRFRVGGKMDKHFKSTNWYSPKYANVDLFLTEIESRNIEKIRSLEKQ